MEFTGLALMAMLLLFSVMKRIVRPKIEGKYFKHVTPDDIRQGLDIYLYRSYHQVYDRTYVVLEIGEEIEVLSIKSGRIYKMSMDVVSHMYCRKGN